MPAKKPAPKPVGQRPSKPGSKPARAHAPPPTPERVAVKAPEITPAERRELRAKAHHLHPVVTVGQHGLTPSVLHELDVNLLAHELIKVRVFSDARAERDELFARICTELDAAPVQHIGKLLVLWRPVPPAEPATKKATYRRRPGATGDTRAGKSPPPRGRARDTAAGEEPRGKRRPLSRPLGKNAKTSGSTTGKTMAKSTPQARHPRSPEARTVARPPSSPPAPARGPAGVASASDAGGRRQRGQAGAGPRGPAGAPPAAPTGSSDNRRRRRGG